MADLFLHLPFARRLRLAEGLHPLIGETLARRQALVALGASLPRLPGVERKGMSFFRRLFSGGSDAARWQKVFAGTPSPQARLVCNYLQPTNDTGPMARLAIALGALSHELVEAKLAPVMSSVSPGDRPGVERAQARLWLQAVIPNSRDLGAEWRGLTEFTDLDQSRRIFDHVDAALGATYSQRPGRDVLVRWGKGLVSEVGPLEEAGLPPSLNVTDHAARGPHFDDNGFVPALQAAMEWFVILANRLGEACTDGELTDEQVTTALCAGDAALVENDEEAAARPERWTTWIQATRARMLDRGKNEEPAFIEGVGEVKPVHRSNAFTGMMNLADLPQDQLPPELNNPSLPPESAAASPPVPHTQEISLANLEAMGSDAARPPLPLDASGPLPVAPRPPAPPALTQEISVAQIEEAHASFPTPAHTQEISALQIEGEAAAAVPPAAPVPTPAAPPPEAPAVAAPAAPAPPAPPPPVSVDGMVATTPTPPADATAAPTAPVPPVAADGLVASTPSAPSAPVSADGIVATTPPATGDDADPPRE